MGNLIEIKKRIASIQTTVKITKVMHMISVAKMNRLKSKIHQFENNSQKANDLFYESLSKIDQNLAQNFLKPSSKKTLVVVLGSEKGMCGNSNTLIFKELKKVVNGDFENFQILSIGKKITSSIKKDSIFSKLIINKKDFNSEINSSTDIQEITKIISDSILSQEIGKCIVIHSHFVNIITSEIKVLNLFPVLPKKSDLNFNIDSDFDINSVFHITVGNLIKFIINDNILAINSNRTRAMDNATKNGNELIDTLLLKYNKTRQSMITSELSDIVSGAQAVQ